MGYSCTKAASDTLAAIGYLYQRPHGDSVIRLNHRDFFFERGRENRDGAITGKLMELFGDNMCEYVASIRINPDGTVERFPFLSNFKRQAVKELLAKAHSDSKLYSDMTYLLRF